MTWSNEKNILVIELYREKECLWNPLNKDHKCRNSVYDAWAEIAIKTDTTVDELKKKVKNLVAQFYRERKNRSTAKKSGAGAKRMTKWFAYNYLLFLKDKNKVRHFTEGGIQKQNNLESTNSSLDEEDDYSEEYTEYICSENEMAVKTQESQAVAHDVAVAGDISPASSNTTILQAVPTQKKMFKSPKKVSKSKKNNDIEQRQEEAYSIMKDMYNNKKSRKNSDIFGEFVASKIESLKTDYAKNTVEHLISNILWQAGMGKYDQPPQSARSYSNSPSHSTYDLPTSQHQDNWMPEDEPTNENINFETIWN